jgi:hypothetical protein
MSGPRWKDNIEVDLNKSFAGAGTGLIWFWIGLGGALL